MKRKWYIKRAFAATLVGAVMMLAGCQEGKKSETMANYVTDSLTSRLYDLMSDRPEEALALVDSLEKVGIINEPLANCRKAQIYSEQYHPRVSGIYAKRALANELFKNDARHRYFAYNLLINSAMNVGDTENGLKYATEALAATREDTSRHARLYAPDFMVCVGNCQMKLGHAKEASESYERAWTAYEEILKDAKSFSWYYPELMLTMDAINDFSSDGDMETARQWLPRLQSSFERTVSTTDIPASVKDDCTANMEIVLALFYQRDKNRAEAERHYEAYQQTNFAQSAMGRRRAVDYLMMDGRWQELEQAVAAADTFYRENDEDRTMGYLTHVMARRFMAQEKQGQSEAALRTASKLINLLDTVQEATNKENTAELAVVYETQEKEQKIAEQRADLIRQRLVAVAVAFVLSVVFFVIYTLNRRTAARRLAALSAQKERIESELRIARNIQMSMVPSTFPQRKGLDMFAQMTPAKEVGGDLYDYILVDDSLYFCVGDVSGKGVPASLFMAQTIRLFRSIAKQRHKPVTIANRINAELTENNEEGMFVTMFIGCLDLETGLLRFCNAGHNPPVIGTSQFQFIKMLPNAPIGLLPDLVYEGEEIANVKGRRLLIYTDGLNEAENPQQEQFGEERILEIMRDHHNSSAQQLITTLAAEVDRHRQGAEANDDLTMMAISFDATGAVEREECRAY